MKYIWINKDATEGKSKVTWGAPFEWDHLESKPQTLRADTRFTLYGDDNKTNALFIDIDDVPHDQKTQVAELIARIFSIFRYYIVDTGGGLHCYIPAKQTLGKEEIYAKRASYKQLIQYISRELTKLKLKGKVDNVFKYRQLGRLPGVLNTRRKRFTKLLATNPSGIPYDFGKLKSEAITFSATAPKKKSEVMPEAVLAECGVLKNFMAAPKEYMTYDIWFALGCVFTDLGMSEKFLELSTPYLNNVEERREKLKDATTYTFSCRAIREKLYAAKIPKIPCKTCVHYGSCPSYISGPLPTPSRKNGFAQMYGKNREGQLIELDKPIIHYDDIFNHFVNLNRKVLCRHAETGDFYIYRDNKWERAYNKKLEACCVDDMRDRLHELIPNMRLTVKQRDLLDHMLRVSTKVPLRSEKNFDRKSTLVFKNTAFEVDIKARTITEVALGPELGNRNCIDADYDADADCPLFMEYLDFITDCDKDMQDVISMIFGLAVANIPPNSYQKFFWIYGGSGTGKSTLVGILDGLVEGSVAILRPDKVASQHGLPDLRGKAIASLRDVRWGALSEVKQSQFWEFMLNITGDEGVALKLPHVAQYRAQVNCLIIATSNEGCEGVGSEDGVLRRFVPLQLYKKVKNPDMEFHKKVLDEKAGLYAFAFRGLQLVLDGGIERYIANSEAHKEMVEATVAAEANPISEFVKTYYRKGKGDDAIGNDDILADYAEYTEMPLETDKYTRRNVLKRVRMALVEVLGAKPTHFKAVFIGPAKARKRATAGIIRRQFS